MPQAGFEPTVPASEPLQTRAVDGVATGIGVVHFNQYYIWFIWLVDLYRTCTAEFHSVRYLARRKNRDNLLQFFSAPAEKGAVISATV